VSAEQTGRSSFEDQLKALETRIDELRDARPSTDGDDDVLLTELESAQEELRVADEEVRAQQEELDRLIQNLRTERWMHERMIAVLPVAVLVTNGDGLVQMANASAAALLRMRVDRLLRKPLFAYVDAGDRGALRRQLTEAVRSRGAFRTMTTVYPRQADPVSVEVAATFTGDPATGGVEMTWVLLSAHRIGSELPDRGGGAYVARSLVDLARLPLTTSDTSEILTRVAHTCQYAFARPVAVSISLGEPLKPDLVATDSRFAQDVDGAQIVAGDGPCHTAWQDRMTVTSDDLREDERWPRLRRQLGPGRPLSAVAVPVSAGDDLVGSLNLYSEEQRLPEQATVETAELLGSTVAAVLHEVELRSDLQSVATNLEHALESRSTIDQAKGMIMAARRCGPEEAFRVLVKMSSTSNVKLRDVAARLVADATARE
jgi:GAF domain-containing protein